MAMKVVYANVNGQLLSETRAGARKLYSLDPLGNTRALYDNTLTKTDTFEYFPSGTVAARTGTTPTPFQWVGGSGYYRDNSKRVHVRARNFYVNLGRWAETDPIGFGGGDYNLYRYVKNRFVVMIDPSGLHYAMSCRYHIPFMPRIFVDYNPVIKNAIDSAQKAFQSRILSRYYQIGGESSLVTCPQGCFADFVLATENIKDVKGLNQSVKTWMQCYGNWFKSTNQRYECDARVERVAHVGGIGGCAVGDDGTFSCAYAPEMGSTNGHLGRIYFCPNSLIGGLIGSVSCANDVWRTHIVLHELGHLCSEQGSVRDKGDAYHLLLDILAHCIQDCPQG